LREIGEANKKSSCDPLAVDEGREILMSPSGKVLIRR
jgi:hypothetical protein